MRSFDSGPTRPSSRTSAPAARSQASQVATAVLIDGSALFLSFRSLFEGRSLDYRALVHVLSDNVSGLQPPPRSGPADQPWVMWTSASSQNPGQSKFLEFAEQELRWEVRAFPPADSFMVEPTTILGISAESRAASRLVRFDASISFAIGRLAESHRLVVVSDSFALADPLRRAAALAGPGRKPYLAFFSRALDSRWQRVLRTGGDTAPHLLDLDDHEEGLFGAGSAPTRPEPRASGLFF